MGQEIESISSNITKFADIVDIVINLEKSISLNSLWGLSIFDNSTKTFLFKLHNNQLGVNSRVAHFVRGHDKNCTFCTLSHIAEDNPESVQHLFYDCRITENILQNFFSRIFNLPTRMVSRSEFFAGFALEQNCDNKLLDVITALVKKFIWDSKLRFELPSTANLIIFVCSEIKRFKTQSNLFCALINRCTLFQNNPSFNF